MRNSTTVSLQTEVFLTELLQGVQALDSPTLEVLADEVMALRARRRAPSLPHDETLLLKQINQGLPEAIRLRFEELKEKRQADTLSRDEHEELLAIIDQIEQRNVDRLRALTTLAQLRGLSLRDVMTELGVATAPDHRPSQ